MIYLGNGNQSKVVHIGIFLFLYIIIGIVPVQSDILKTENPTSKSYTCVVALVGGGNNPQPGEISLAHNGVLFLDELGEYAKTTLEVLRLPLENRKIVISRAKYTVEYPASFMLVASTNPCPCGYYGDPTHHCVCTPGQIAKYMTKLSLSARAYTRNLKVARTIADLAGSERVESQHIAEAVGYRNLDRGDWAERGI